MAIVKYMSVAEGKTPEEALTAINRLGMLMAGVVMFFETPKDAHAGERVDGREYTLYSVTIEKVETTQ